MTRSCAKMMTGPAQSQCTECSTPYVELWTGRPSYWKRCIGEAVSRAQNRVSQPKTWPNLQTLCFKAITQADILVKNRK